MSRVNVEVRVPERDPSLTVTGRRSRAHAPWPIALTGLAAG